MSTLFLFLLQSFQLNIAVNTKKYRLPPQIAYVGEDTLIHLGDHFESETGIDVTYALFMYDDDVYPPQRISNMPSWIQWDDTIPTLSLNPPSNYTDINPFYEFRIMAMGESHKEPDIEEKVVVVIAHECFNKCPKHYGVGCEDWEIWFGMAIVYAAIMFISGCVVHCSLEKAHNWVMNRDRPVNIDDERIERRIKYKKLNLDDLSDDDDSSDYDDDDFNTGKRKPLLYSVKKCVWIICYNCCGVKSDRIL